MRDSCAIPCALRALTGLGALSYGARDFKARERRGPRGTAEIARAERP